MLATKGMRFPIDVILVCIRWYSAYPLSYRHLEEMMKGSLQETDRRVR
ncbi:transposase-like protein [Polaromonas sp. CG_23.6]|nr:transposase-like protein [Polaromonas sp. CG_23.6]